MTATLSEANKVARNWAPIRSPASCNAEFGGDRTLTSLTARSGASTAAKQHALDAASRCRNCDTGHQWARCAMSSSASDGCHLFRVHGQMSPCGFDDWLRALQPSPRCQRPRPPNASFTCTARSFPIERPAALRQARRARTGLKRRRVRQFCLSTRSQEKHGCSCEVGAKFCTGARYRHVSTAIPRDDRQFLPLPVDAVRRLHGRASAR
jgi:hypothetical protein